MSYHHFSMSLHRHRARASIRKHRHRGKQVIRLFNCRKANLIIGHDNVLTEKHLMKYSKGKVCT
ncbi:hypothetical protein G0032_09335 [Streptococcus thermophilus]|uniref:hypothetical protein n=1 Tax=Streptococcus thermophilus TaxID=1308 RepID=UPI0013DCC2C1|nr:hypothetical protein [Streptococcus thermophilus]MBW7814979.1 hypothetical protein [Streptococcus thermophilus]NDY12169.1 hypothetical protein [Streptococcus thermophilus]